MTLILQWLILSVALMLTAWIVPGIVVSDFRTALFASVVIALINVFIRPVILLLLLPINILTLGVSVLFINAFLLLFVAHVVKGVTITNFFSAFIGAIVLSVLTVALS